MKQTNVFCLLPLSFFYNPYKFQKAPQNIFVAFLFSTKQYLKDTVRNYRFSANGRVTRLQL